MGGLLTLAANSWFSYEKPSPPVQPVNTEGELFKYWASDDESLWDLNEEVKPPECSFWDGSVQFESALCNHFSLSRISSSVHTKATGRALRCAAFVDTECVLSPEIGLSIPAAFVYDGSGMKMIIAPTLTNLENGKISKVRLQDPVDGSSRGVVEFNNSIKIEFMEGGGSRAPVVEVLTGADAFCVQLLRKAFDDSCWHALD